MKNWIEPTGKLIGDIGKTDFPSTLSQALGNITPFDYTVIFGYHGKLPPLDLFDTFPSKKRKVYVEDYQEGPYLLDPFYLTATSSFTSGLYRLKEIAPDRFYQGEYFRNYYIQTGLAEEIGFLVNLPQRSSLVISLMRADRSFSAKEFRELRDFLPIVLSATQKHWADLDKQFNQNSADKKETANEHNLERAFNRFGEGVLTPREREVVEYTLKGHSAEAVGKILGIASGTVRIHRKNIYSKLRINSQGELFSRFIEMLSMR